MRTTRWFLGLCIVMGLSAFAGTAAADDKVANVKSDGKKGDLIYDFPDADDLKGNEMGAVGAQIKIPKYASRQRLMRVRGSFVQELLKSVENM